MRRTVLPVALATTMLALGGSMAHAGLYIGGAAGGQTTQGFDVADINDGSLQAPTNVDDSDVTYKVFLGFTFLRFVGIEAHYTDLGSVSVSGTSNGTGPIYSAGPVEGTAEATGWGLNAMGILPVGKWRLWVKLGALRWSDDSVLKNNGQVIDSGSDSGTDPLFGIGVSFALSRRFALQLEGESTKLDDLDVNMLTLGLRFNF